MNVNGQRNGNYHKSITITDQRRSNIGHGWRKAIDTLYETQTVKVAPRHVSLLEAIFSLKFFLLSHVFLMFKLKKSVNQNYVISIRKVWNVLILIIFLINSIYCLPSSLVHGSRIPYLVSIYIIVHFFMNSNFAQKWYFLLIQVSSFQICWNYFFLTPGSDYIRSGRHPMKKKFFWAKF